MSATAMLIAGYDLKFEIRAEIRGLFGTRRFPPKNAREKKEQRRLDRLGVDGALQTCAQKHGKSRDEQAARSKREALSTPLSLSLSL